MHSSYFFTLIISGYPLQILPEKVEVLTTPVNREFVRKILPNLNWPALRAAAASLGVDSLPEVVNEELRSDDSFIDALHHILMDVHVTDGRLVCPESGQVFAVRNGIVDMMYVLVSKQDTPYRILIFFPGRIEESLVP